jgi:hypothetical protein
MQANDTEFDGGIKPLAITDEVLGPEENDEINTEAELNELPPPWRMTRTPQPKATHPGMPKPLETLITDPEIEPAKTFKEAYERMAAAYWEYLKATGTRHDPTIIKAWAIYRKLALAWCKMQQGAPPIEMTAQSIGKAHASHQDSVKEYRLKQLAYQNLDVEELLEAYQAAELEIYTLKAKIIVLEVDVEQLTLAAADAAIRWGEAQGYLPTDETIEPGKTDAADLQSSVLKDGKHGETKTPRSIFGKFASAVFGDAQKDVDAAKV